MDPAGWASLAHDHTSTGELAHNSALQSCRTNRESMPHIHSARESTQQMHGTNASLPLHVRASAHSRTFDSDFKFISGTIKATGARLESLLQRPHATTWMTDTQILEV